MSKQRSRTGTTVLRRNFNYWAAWTVTVGYLVLLVGVDFLHLYSAFSTPDQDDSFIDALP